MSVKSLSDQVYEFVVKLIQNGEVYVGDKISEGFLVEKMGISRTPIREALIQLSADDILENVPRKGFFVKRVDEKKKNDIYSLIGMIDSYAIGKAMPKMTDEVINELENAIKKMDMAISLQVYEQYYEYQEMFHELYRNRCGNDAVGDTIKYLEKKIIRVTYFDPDIENLYSMLSQMNDEHMHILEAIKSGDVEESKKRVYEHWHDDARDSLFEE